jgi:hypothetical protein
MVYVLNAEKQLTRVSNTIMVITIVTIVNTALRLMLQNRVIAVVRLVIVQ